MASGGRLGPGPPAGTAGLRPGPPRPGLGPPPRSSQPGVPGVPGKAEPKVAARRLAVASGWWPAAEPPCNEAPS